MKPQQYRIDIRRWPAGDGGGFVADGRDISGRLWSTVTIVAGVSTAISATIGAGVALLLKAGGL